MQRLSSQCAASAHSCTSGSASSSRIPATPTQKRHGSGASLGRETTQSNTLSARDPLPTREPFHHQK